jgi:polynucleotide 5'-kinase involved in rRNA processing
VLLLVADPKWSWRTWLKENLGQRDLVCLDVSNADYGPPARVFHLHEGKVRNWRFVGSVYPQRNPVDLLAGAADLIAKASDDAVVLSFEIHGMPIHRQMALALSENARIRSVLVPEGSQLLHEPWLIEAETIALQESLPENAQAAQRRARWLEMLEGCSEHMIELDHIGIHGVRLGSGQRLHGAPFDDLGIHVEVYGSTLLVVTGHDVDEQMAGDALNLAHATKLSLVSPDAYDGLLCSFVRGSGEDFGIGVVKGIDFHEREATFLNNAVAPAPVRSVRIGSLRIDETGKETGETKPWAV